MLVREYVIALHNGEVYFAYESAILKRKETLSEVYRKAKKDNVIKMGIPKSDYYKCLDSLDLKQENHDNAEGSKTIKRGMVKRFLYVPKKNIDFIIDRGLKEVNEPDGYTHQ